MQQSQHPQSQFAGIIKAGAAQTRFSCSSNNRLQGTLSLRQMQEQNIVRPQFQDQFAIIMDTIVSLNIMFSKAYIINNNLRISMTSMIHSWAWTTIVSIICETEKTCRLVRLKWLLSLVSALVLQTTTTFNVPRIIPIPVWRWATAGNVSNSSTVLPASLDVIDLFGSSCHKLLR